MDSHRAALPHSWRTVQCSASLCRTHALLITDKMHVGKHLACQLEQLLLYGCM